MSAAGSIYQLRRHSYCRVPLSVGVGSGGQGALILFPRASTSRPLAQSVSSKTVPFDWIALSTRNIGPVLPREIGTGSVDCATRLFCAIRTASLAPITAASKKRREPIETLLWSENQPVLAMAMSAMVERWKRER